jgi:hypothetical protein
LISTIEVLAMKPTSALVLAASVLTAAGLAAAVLGASDITAASASKAGAATLSAAAKKNGFERPGAGAGYSRSQWAADGWSAPWDLGMDNRSRIDNSTAHTGGKSLRVLYPKGAAGPRQSGLSAPFQVTPAREVYLSQWFKLSSNFSWGTSEYSGKIGIGLAGGASCSGGDSCDGFNGFESRIIWNTNGRAALYYYHMDHPGRYGTELDFSVDGKKVFYPRNQWINVVQRLKVNTVTSGQADRNGEIEIWYNGKRAALVTGLQFVRNSDLVDKAYFDSFFGGDRASFAPANDSYIFYDDVTVSPNRADICELSRGGCGNTPPSPGPRPSPQPSPTSSPNPPNPSPSTNPGGTAWAPNTPYSVGQTVTYTGGKYRCLQAHTSLEGWTPAAVPALWRKV